MLFFGRLDLNAKPPREVAIKLMNLDDVDYLANTMEKDEALNEVRQEINVLMQLKDHGVRNVNLIHDVIEVDGLLWLICEYCPGGSLRTLVSTDHFRYPELQHVLRCIWPQHMGEILAKTRAHIT